MFATPLGLLGLLALPAIVGLHLFKRRYKPRTVSALFLWDLGTTAPTSGRNREPLRRNASLALELLAAFLLSMALAQPLLQSPTAQTHVVAIVDGTASMQARDANGESSLERAQHAIEAMVDGLPNNSRVTLIRTGPQPSVIAGPLAFPAEAKEALGNLQCPFASADTGAAFDLATELGRGADVIYITDDPDAASGRSAAMEVDAGAEIGVRVMGVGISLGNVGIVGALRSPALDRPSAETLRLVIRSFAAARETRTLRLTRVGEDDEVLFERALDLAAGSVETVTLRLPEGTPSVRALLSDAGAHDSFALDDVATLAPVPHRRLRIFADVPDDVARALGLVNAANAGQRWASLIPDATVAADLASAHVALMMAPASAPTWSLVLGAHGDDPVHLVSPFLMDRTHALLTGVTLDGVVWSTERSTSAEGAGLVVSGMRSLVGEEIAQDGTRTWDFALDPLLSTLGRSADWPIILANAAEARRAELPGPVRTSLGASESFRWRSAEDGEWILLSPTGARTPLERLPSGDLLTRPLTEVGSWSVLLGGLPAAEVGVSLLSATESDLRSASSQDPAAPAAVTTGDGPAGSTLPLIEALLAAGAILAMLLNWWIVSPRGKHGAAA